MLSIARDGLPLITVSAIPLAILLLGAAVGLDTALAEDLALYADTLLLLVGGYRMSRDAGVLVGFRLLISTMVSGLLGLTMVGLKIVLSRRGPVRQPARAAPDGSSRPASGASAGPRSCPSWLCGGGQDRLNAGEILGLEDGVAAIHPDGPGSSTVGWVGEPQSTRASPAPVPHVIQASISCCICSGADSCHLLPRGHGRAVEHEVLLHGGLRRSLRRRGCRLATASISKEPVTRVTPVMRPDGHVHHAVAVSRAARPDGGRPCVRAGIRARLAPRGRRGCPE